MIIQLVECVPNISEGRDLKVIDTLAKAVQEVEGVALLDRHIDPDHNRTVFTIAGFPEVMLRAVYELVRVAEQLIDLSKHQGMHPRVGAIDVIPFIPIQGMTMDDCCELARKLGGKIGSELQLPVFLYAEASGHSPNRRLETIRRGGCDGLRERMESAPEWRPAFGPTQLHHTAGAVVVGARDFLIAYNVVLQSNDLMLAQMIAKRIRTVDGGLPSLKAMGVELKSRDLVQVSMNLTNYQETSMYDAYCAVLHEAERHGVSIVESELVGLAPQEAIPSEHHSILKFRVGNPDQTLEARLAQVGFV